MAVRFQVVINCTGQPERLARFWAEALGYVLEPPPAGFASWDGWRRDIGLPESWLGRGTDCIIDPDGAGPRIWIQVVPGRKTTTNGKSAWTPRSCGCTLLAPRCSAT